MNTQARIETEYLRAAVQAAEGIASLPAVATQDWCDQAAGALLAASPPSVALTLLAQLDDAGRIVNAEATGVAGTYIAEVMTMVGRPVAATSVVPIDARGHSLSHLRSTLAQAAELGWTPGPLQAGATRTGLPDQLAQGGAGWRSGPLCRRWSGVNPNGLLLGAIGLGTGLNNRVLVVELGLTGSGAGAMPTEAAQSIFNAVLPALARRAMLAIGTEAGDASHWLTVREQGILQHLLLGKTVREIATELGRSPHTIHDHVKSLHRKLGASSRGELIARALGYLHPVMHPLTGTPGPTMANDFSPSHA